MLIPCLHVNSPASVSIINIPDEPESIINDQPIVPNADLATGAKLPNTCKSNKETMRSQSFTDVVSTMQYGHHVKILSSETTYFD